jgi:hypothetical protein
MDEVYSDNEQIKIELRNQKTKGPTQYIYRKVYPDPCFGGNRIKFLKRWFKLEFDYICHVYFIDAQKPIKK